MQVVIEGFIYQVQAKGGISRIFNETLPRMCVMDKNMRVTILTDGASMQSLPAHPSISFQHGDCDPLFKRSRCALWHSTYFTPPPEWAGVQIVSVYDMVPERFSNLFCDPWDDALRERRKSAILKANAIIAISESTKRDLVEILGVDPAKISVTHLSHNPLFRRLASEALPGRGQRPFFLYVGDRNHYKNFDGLLRGFAAWPGRRDADLCVVGRPFSGAEADRVAALGVGGSVRMLGPVSDEQLCVLYNTAAAFVYPSLGEGFGIPLLEAMACGCPVIASDIPSSREVAGDCPLYFEPSRPEGLPDAYAQVLEETRDSDRVRKGLGLAGTYSWEKTAAATLEVYRKALSAMGRYSSCAFPAGHYYSPVPDLENVARTGEAYFSGSGGLAGIDLDEQGQLALWEELRAYRADFPFADEPGTLRFGLSNGFFGHGDAWTLHGVLRKFRPARLVEVGSGHSSAAILDINDLFLGGALQTTFIDPYPERLLSLLREADRARVQILQKPVQEVGTEVFEQLGENDVLFVDSSHVSKFGSDVNHVLFEVLPRLKSGVIIHFHDVFHPFEYPRNWIMGGRFWNECYVLRAFLQDNPRYFVMLFNSFLAQAHGRRIAAEVPMFLERDPANKWVEGCSSLWLRKK